MTEPELLTPAEVAALFRVDPKTVSRWAKEKKLSWIRTVGGHRRYHAAEVHALLNRTHSPGPLQTLIDDHYDGDPLRALQDLANRYGLAVTVHDRTRNLQTAGSGPPDQPAAAGHPTRPAQPVPVYQPSQELREPTAQHRPHPSTREMPPPANWSATPAAVSRPDRQATLETADRRSLKGGTDTNPRRPAGGPHAT